MYIQPILHIRGYHWDSSSTDTDDKMRRPSLTAFYHTAREPSLTAPWPEPPSPISTKTFEFFPFLPDAVRRKIWAFALPGPRVIEIQYTNKQHEFRSPIPILLHVNRESRSVALMHYETAAASPLNELSSALGHHNLTYLNFEKDTFCPVISFRSFITGEWKTFLRTLPNYAKIHRFGLPKRSFLFPTPACIPLLLQYSSLKEVVVLADPCIDHHPRKDERNEEGWLLDPGKLLPTLQLFECGADSGKEEVFERYVVSYIDKVREAWREKYKWELRFVYKRVCWGGQCWEDGDEIVVEEKVVERKGKKTVRRVMGMPRRGVARVMMLVV